MNKKPIIIVSGEPYSVFLEIFFNTFKKKLITKSKKPIILIVSKNLLLQQMKELNYNLKVNEINPKNILKNYKKEMINIINVELVEKNDDYFKFSLDLQIKDLKNFTNLISQIKQSNLNFKIIRHKQKKNAFIRRIFENFKRN